MKILVLRHSAGKVKNEGKRILLQLVKWNMSDEIYEYVLRESNKCC